MIYLQQSTTVDLWNVVIVSYIVNITLLYFIVGTFSYADTAYAENSGLWYLFDDRNVEKVPVEVSTILNIY